MNLDAHGAACRCLLRMREDHGEPGMSDATFLARFLPDRPSWQERPGATDLAGMLDVAKELRLADRTDVFRGYEHVLAAHRAGHGVVVYTEFAPEQIDPPRLAGRYVLLLAEADEETFALWCPYPSGLSEILPRAACVWWDRWNSLGIVCQRGGAR